MKKYIQPISKVVEFKEDEFCETMIVGSDPNGTDGSEALSKERQSVDFSDEESIW